MFLKKYLVWIITFVFFILPFFWFPFGAIDIGGDGTRLYFYDPINFFKNVSLYALAPEGRGTVDPTKHAYLIYVLFLECLYYFFRSPYLLVCLFSGIKLSIGFLSIYFIVKEFIQADKIKINQTLILELVAILSGIFYIISTGSEKLIFFWVKPLFSHDQIFLNPLMFLLLLRFFLTRNIWYLLSAIFLTFLFSPNFSMIGSPAFFSFYPLVCVFLLIYIIFIRKRIIPVKSIIIAFIFFLGLHAFHLLPELMTLFDKGSISNNIVFKEAINSGVNFFVAIRGEGKVSTSLLLPSPLSSLHWTNIFIPLVVIIGFLFQKKKRKTILLTSCFFLITLFLVSANITNIGFDLYRRFFYFPGFAMFRHFFVQWAFVFIFFYTLLFGQCLFIVFSRLKDKYVTLVALIIVTFFIIGFWNFLNGELVNATQWGSKNVKTAMIMDPRYEQTIGFIRHLPDEGKILVFPLTDNFNQVVFGLNNAAYVGPSSISFLTPKMSFVGYQNFDNYPYTLSERILKLARKKDYKELTQIFSLFNIRYIFHNTDPKVYEEKFNQFPNSYMMTSFPKTQNEYKQFVKMFPITQIYRNGPYEMYEFKKSVQRNDIYIPESVYRGNITNGITKKTLSYQSAFIEQNECKKSSFMTDFCRLPYTFPKASISIKKFNPTYYFIHIKQVKSLKPFLLVFQNSFHSGWKLILDQGSTISEDKHVLVNRYANGWVITSDDRKGKQEYSLVLRLENQKYFVYGLYVTGFSLSMFLLFTLFYILKKKYV